MSVESSILVRFVMRVKHQFERKEVRSMNDLIARIADLTNELKAICDENPALDVRVENDKSEVFINSLEVFFDTFEHFGHEQYDSTTCAHELFVDVKGVKFYTILTQIEYEKYVQKK